MSLTPAELAALAATLQRVADDPSLVANDERVKALLAKCHKRGRKSVSDANADAVRRQRRAAQAGTERVRRAVPACAALAAPPDLPPEYARGVPCYVCKAPFTAVDRVYHALCPDCAGLNRAKRTQRADLTGRRALLTGGRIKIGHALGLKLLRDGAELIVTTRFPADAHRRYAAEPDAAEFLHRLTCVGLDLRDLPSVEAFAQQLVEEGEPLDILVNNAAQTIRRPLAYYRELVAAEAPALLEARANPNLPALPDQAWFPPGAFDADGQPLDLRPENSWSRRLHEVGTLELVEVQLVNAVAPFVLCARLKPLMLASPFARRFVVNVSAMEGQFSRANKTAAHPHTNMAKAALNMLTRTSAQDYRADGIYMTSVDTGWITDENPHATAKRLRDAGFVPPLDIADGAARVYDPVALGVTDPEEPFWGVFLKDYAPHPW